MIKIIATLCSLAQPTNCHEQVITTSDYADLNMSGCMVGMPAIAKWMNQHPAERLAGWKCQIGEPVKKQAM